ncbi:type II/IV secretion system protein [Candidatus Giovannonibacteria bacterium]|nr:type II/IV secretion system protein [Candidatus Giovannonibacteria bacterium]
MKQGENSKTRSTIDFLRKKEEEELAQTLAQKHGLQYLDLSLMTIDIDSLKIIPEQEAKSASLAVIQSVGKKLQIAVTNPDRPEVSEILDNLKRKNYEIQLFLVSPTSIERAFIKYKEIPRFEEIKSGLVNINQSKIETFGQKIKSLKAFKEEMRALSQDKVSRKASESLELLLAGALEAEASDIHLEPVEDGAKIRFRIDGVLQEISDISKELFLLILSRIKLVSEVKLNVHDRPQDGRFTIRINTEDIEVRTSILPGPYGESVVTRILLPKTIAITFENLGIHHELKETIEKELSRPNGMILTTGPTGSGKTTTLYAFLKKVASVEVKVVTIEDPIEYHLPYVTQTQVDQSKTYDFSNGLKSILRQDPDIILVGEIRDLETAETAMHAALTGHLVFSTLHTNNAAGTIPRLIDLGVKTNIIAPAINSVIAQRLVRRLCKNCKKEYEPDEKEREQIEKILKNIPEKFKKNIVTKKFKLWSSGECEACNFTGFKGRIGIFELFLIDDKVERLILKNPAEADINEMARMQQMLTLYQDGILKVLGGITSFEELNRVVSV